MIILKMTCASKKETEKGNFYLFTDGVNDISIKEDKINFVPLEGQIYTIIVRPSCFEGNAYFVYKVC